MKTLSLAKETLRVIAEDRMDEIQGGIILSRFCSGACSNRRTCFTHFEDCSTSPNILC